MTSSKISLWKVNSLRSIWSPFFVRFPAPIGGERLETWVEVYKIKCCMAPADGFSDWPQEDTEEAAQGAGNAQHLWEESWDDDDTSEDFSKVLK